MDICLAFRKTSSSCNAIYSFVNTLNYDNEFFTFSMNLTSKLGSIFAVLSFCLWTGLGQKSTKPKNQLIPRLPTSDKNLKYAWIRVYPDPSTSFFCRFQLGFKMKDQFLCVCSAEINYEIRSLDHVVITPFLLFYKNYSIF